MYSSYDSMGPVAYDSMGPGVIFVIVGIFLLIFAVLFVILIASWVLQAIPLYKLAKKAGRTDAWLAWVPVFPGYFQTYLLSDLAGDTEFNYVGLFKISNRTAAFWTYVGVAVLGPTLMLIIVSILSLIPIIGLLAPILSFIPQVVLSIANYVFLKDAANVFRADEKHNSTSAVVVTILDACVTLGFAKAYFLFKLLKDTQETSVLEGVQPSSQS